MLDSIIQSLDAGHAILYLLGMCLMKALLTTYKREMDIKRIPFLPYLILMVFHPLISLAVVIWAAVDAPKDHRR